MLPLPTTVFAVLFGLRHNLPDEVFGEVFGCSQAMITRYHEILQEVDQVELVHQGVREPPEDGR